MAYNDAEKTQIGRVLDKVYEVLEKTDNDVTLEIGFNGVHLYSFHGSISRDAEFVISDSEYFDFGSHFAERMIAELNVLMKCSKEKEHHEEDEA